jgi:hypothetical protein
MARIHLKKLIPSKQFHYLTINHILYYIADRKPMAHLGGGSRDARKGPWGAYNYGDENHS